MLAAIALQATLGKRYRDVVGEKVRFEGRDYLVIDVLEEHLLVIANNRVWPANPLVIPKGETSRGKENAG